MPRFGDQLEKLLKQQDERNETLQSEIEQTRRAANLRLPTLPPYAPVWQSADAKTLVRELNQFGEREEMYKVAAKGNRDGQFSSISAKYAKFDVSPLETYVVYRIGAQSIPNNTETIIQFTNSDQAYSGFFTRDDAVTPEQIGVTNNLRTVGVLGMTQWANNGTGRRAVHLNAYDASDSLLSGVTLSSLGPSGVDIDTIPFTGLSWLVGLPTVHHLKFTVIQTSGGALDLGYAVAGLFLLR